MTEFTEKVAVMDQKSMGSDIEKTPSIAEGTAVEAYAGVDNAGYHRALTRRQVMMMTFGAGIGTGLWVGTGTALKYAGPGGIAVAYTVVA
jgi:amino acid transporter